MFVRSCVLLVAWGLIVTSCAAHMSDIGRVAVTKESARCASSACRIPARLSTGISVAPTPRASETIRLTD